MYLFRVATNTKAIYELLNLQLKDRDAEICRICFSSCIVKVYLYWLLFFYMGGIVAS